MLTRALEAVPRGRKGVVNKGRVGVLDSAGPAREPAALPRQCFATQRMAAAIPLTFDKVDGASVTCRPVRYLSRREASDETPFPAQCSSS